MDKIRNDEKNLREKAELVQKLKGEN